MKTTVRAPRVSDISDIRRLLGQLGYDVDLDTLKRRLAGILDRDDHRFLIADLDGRCVGWLHAAVSDYIDSGPFVVIGGLVVDKAHRGAGIGRELMSHAEQWARDTGHTIVRVWSSAPRVRAHEFYKQLGYVHIKTHNAFAKSLTPGGESALQDLVPHVDESAPSSE